MPRPRNSFPKFSVDATGRAFTKVDGRFISLGRADEPEAQVRYADVLKRHAAGELIEPAKQPTSAGVPINVLLLRFCTDELPRYSAAEQFCLKGAMRILRQLFGHTATAEFGPLKLLAVRDAMVKRDPTLKDEDGKPSPRKPWSRGFTNHQTSTDQRTLQQFLPDTEFLTSPMKISTSRTTQREPIVIRRCRRT